MIHLLIPGDPVPKGRPRVTTRGSFTPERTREAEEKVVYHWQQAGEPCISGVGPLEVRIVLTRKRPKGHRLKDGSLTLAGREAGEHAPTKPADWDNLAKLVTDALNGRAYQDDGQIVQAVVSKRWADEGDEGSTLITIKEWVDAERF